MTATQTGSDAGLATALQISLIRLARRLRAGRMAPGLEPELSGTQLATLAALERRAAVTPGELAEHERVQPPSMSRVIAALEDRGLVARAPHPTDRRQIVLTITGQGRELVHQSCTLKEAWLARRLKELSPQERSALLAATPVLDKLSQS